MHIYVGKLSFDISSTELKDMFDKYGTVKSANVFRDRFRKDSAAMGFVEMPDDTEAEEAISNLNGKMINGEKIEVHKSREEDRPGDYEIDRRKR